MKQGDQSNESTDYYIQSSEILPFSSRAPYYSVKFKISKAHIFCKHAHL